MNRALFALRIGNHPFFCPALVFSPLHSTRPKRPLVFQLPVGGIVTGAANPGFQILAPNLTGRSFHLNPLFRTGIAGFAAWKWGGGLIGSIILFVIVYYLLGHW